jgi:hypothetical protein
MAQDTQLKVCLGVAVDHRIRRLFKPVFNNPTEHSNHVFRIEALGRSLNRSREAIEVTAQIAGPAVKGGIAVALQQPRHNHPFEKGLNAVFEDCETYVPFPTYLQRFPVEPSTFELTSLSSTCCHTCLKT